MDSEQRTELFKSIADANARRAVLGVFDDGWDNVDTTVRKQSEAMDDAALKAAIIADHEEVNEHGGELARRRLKIRREVFKDRVDWLSATVGEGRNKLERNPPPVLAAAIKRMEQCLEFARNLGKAQFSFSGAPGGDVLWSNKSRTPADEAATQRVEQSLHKLRNLVFVEGDLAQLIAEVVAEADIGGIWTGLPESPPSPVAFDKRRDRLTATSISDRVIAEIEPDGAPQERLSPVG